MWLLRKSLGQSLKNRILRKIMRFPASMLGRQYFWNCDSWTYPHWSDNIVKRHWNSPLSIINLLSQKGSDEPKLRMDLLCVIPDSNPQATSPFPDLFQAPVEGIAILHQFPFSSGLQRMSVVSQKIGEEQYDLYMKGAPETVSSFCRQETGIDVGEGTFTAFIWT